ncbi:MAG: class I SAM-dependent methyltransferase [Acidobacteriota bacterium]|nr:class I SAM-dependent methyltransferase [Acidobacteriota bacterium]MDQ3420771.1 class I SAM-dependent methyltransferase [Acidobacteriota bacterium]
MTSPGTSSTADVRTYWNHHIHDLEITNHPVGTPGFFSDLDQYHFEKLHHLLRLVDFDGWRGKRVLEVGCGAGTDLARFARGGAVVTGVDLAASAIELARKNFEQQGLQGEFREADGEKLPFEDNSFDLVYAHGVVQYTPNGERLVEECRRVLKSGGEAVFQVYNRVSWLNALSKVMKVPLEHEDAPVLRKYSISEFTGMLRGFSQVRIVEERFPVKSRLHKGWKGIAFNTFFVATFNALPRTLVKRYGWHLLAFCRK